VEQVESPLPGFFAVISGPSGSGKTSICRELERGGRVQVTVSATTRPRREGEEEGRDYFFLAPREFRAGVEAGDFLEWAEYNGHLYGTLRSQLQRAWEAGRIPLLEIEVQGAEKLRRAGEKGLFIFIVPPSMAVLEERLRRRGTEKEQEVRRRLAIAEEEWKKARNSPIYDHFVVNDDLDLALARVRELLELEE